MDGNTIYKKTAAGSAAFSSTSGELTQAQRGLLIMIDGKRSVDALRKVASVFGDCDALFSQLLATGMIDLSAVGDASVVVNPQPTGTVPRAVSDAQLADARMAAAKYITERLGPTADKLALQIERSRTLEDLTVNIEIAREILENVSSPLDAEGFERLVAARLL